MAPGGRRRGARNPAAPGSVPTLARYVAAHWDVTWRRLHGTASLDRDLVHTTLPPDGALNFPVDAASDGAPYRRVVWDLPQATR